MIGKKMEEALNGQIKEEMFSAYLYLSMSAWFDSINLKGFANWMRVQWQEELVHALKIFDFVNERQGTVNLKQLDAPQLKWDSPLMAFEAAYKHEQHITKCINNLVQTAIDEKDIATEIFLEWFVNEQVEEEASADEIVQQLKLVGDKGQGLFMINRELGQRTFKPETEAE
jgi:ferritin